MIRRTDQGLLAQWWWTVDKLMMMLVLLLMFLGLVVIMAASQGDADQAAFARFQMVIKQLVFLGPAIVILVGTSFLTPRQIRRLAIFGLIASLVLMVAVLLIGTELNGSRRWLAIPFGTLQPSEFVKPFLVVVCAFLFAESNRRRDMPAIPLAFLVLGITSTLMILQPDFGQTLLTVAVWCALFFIGGLSYFWIAVLASSGVAGIFTAYFMLPHVTSRIDRFLAPGSGDNYQVEKAIQSISSGGWWGRGPGEGVVIKNLPDSHTDYIFAVVAEEFGIAFCIVFASLFAFIVLRGLFFASRERDGFTRLAVSGLMILFGLQAAINMAVSLNLIPSKGMTLPFISSGGSSLLSMAFCLGMAIGLMRRGVESGQAIFGQNGGHLSSFLPQSSAISAR
jgi:cell division protein FtsW